MAVVGGLLTPVLMHSETDQYTALFLYLGVLDLGVVIVALRRPWPAVTTLALAGYAAPVLGLVRRELSPGEAAGGARVPGRRVRPLPRPGARPAPVAGGTRARRAGKTSGAGS